MVSRVAMENGNFIVECANVHSAIYTDTIEESLLAHLLTFQSSYKMSPINIETLKHCFRLVELQQAALKVQTKIDDFHQWGAPAIDLAEYHKKEALQRATKHSQLGSVFWALVVRTPAFANGILGSDNDIVDDGIVAGLARFFLIALKARLMAKPNVIGSALYSEIGPTFYDSLGWPLYESTKATLELASGRNAHVLMEDETKSNKTPLAELLLDENLDHVLIHDNIRLVNVMASFKYDGQEVFASLITRDSLEWQFCVGVYYAQLRGFPHLPTRTGVYIDDDAFIVWCHNLKASTLSIQHARFPTGRPSTIVRLLRVAMQEAQKFQLASVTMWDPPRLLFDDAVTSKLDIIKGEHADSLSHLIVFNQYRTKTPDHSLPLWLNNEKLAWV